MTEKVASYCCLRRFDAINNLTVKLYIMCYPFICLCSNNNTMVGIQHRIVKVICKEKSGEFSKLYSNSSMLFKIILSQSSLLHHTSINGRH